MPLWDSVPADLLLQGDCVGWRTVLKDIQRTIIVYCHCMPESVTRFLKSKKKKKKLNSTDVLVQLINIVLVQVP